MMEIGDEVVSDVGQSKPKGLPRSWVGGDEFVMASIPMTKALGGDIQAAVVAGRIKFLSKPVTPDEDGTQWVDASAADIADGLGLTVKQVRRALTTLEEAGYIIRANRSKSAWDRTLSVALVYES